MSLEIIFAEFGDRSAANQKWVGDIGRLDPTYSQVKKYKLKPYKNWVT